MAMPGQEARTRAAEDEARSTEAWFQRNRRRRPWLIALMGTVWGAFMLPLKDYGNPYWTSFEYWARWLPAFFLLWLGPLVWMNKRERTRTRIRSTDADKNGEQPGR